MMHRLLASLFLFTVAACASLSPNLDGKALLGPDGAATIVREYHDARAPEGPQGDAWRAESASMTGALEQGVSREMFAELAEPVLDRYDQYVASDLDLGPYRRRVWYRTGDVVREVAGLPVPERLPQPVPVE